MKAYSFNKGKLIRLALVVVLLTCTIGAMAQPAKNVESADLLEAIQGSWEWEYLQVKGRPLSRRRDFYATALQVHGNQFNMAFSEASYSGEIVATGERLVLAPEVGDQGYGYSLVMEIKDDRLFLLFPNHVWPLFVSSSREEQVVYCYRRRP